MRCIRLLLSLIGLACVACAPVLQPTPVHPRSLAGEWIADTTRCNAISDQLHAALDNAQQKELRGATKRAARRFSDDQGVADAHLGPYSWEVRDQHEQYQALLEDIRPVSELRVVQQQNMIQFMSPNLAQRNFEAGASSTLVTTFAHLRVESGWQTDEFVVHSKDSKSDIELLERYRIQADGSLLLSVTVSCKYMETQQYTLIYHRRVST